MSFPIRNRVGISDVLGDVLQELAKGIPLTIAELSRRVGADRRTISKVLEMIDQIQSSLEGREMIKIERGNSKIYRFIEDKAKKAVSKAKSFKMRG
ncbi:MAG: hypothetical protein ACFFED_15535 [Candidatus Thorarchaeota archaeon]